MSDESYGLANDDERRALGPILAVSFGFPEEDAQSWFDKTGVDNVRVLKSRGAVVGGLLRIPMGQFFGGESVPMVGIAGVGVSPAARGQGEATRLMQHCIQELAREGVALSCLYPATLPLYRRAGYGIAGTANIVTLRGAALEKGERALTIRAFEPDDEPAVAGVYRSYARLRNGWLDRVPYIWERTRRIERGVAARGHVFCDGAGIEGYVFYRQHRTDHGFDLGISDMAAATPRALSTLLAFLADHRSLAETIRWRGGIDEPLLLLMREHRYDVRFFHHWMLRIVDVAAALTARGYPPSVDGELPLELSDDVIGDNNGRFVLRVADGRASVERGGHGSALRLDVRTLAVLYSSQHSAEQLARVGRIAASDALLARASVLFAGAPPSMGDHF